MKIYDNIKSTILSHIPTILTSILIIIMFWTIANYIYKNIDSDNNIVYNQIKNIIYYTIIIFGISFLLINIGFEKTTIISFLGTLTITLAFSSQAFLSNIMASFYITFNKLFNIGDNIQIQNVSGKVIDYTLFNTTLLNNNNHVIIPNNIFINFPVINNGH